MKKFQDPDGKIYTEDEIKEKYKWTHDYLMEHGFFTEVKENDMREEVIFDATCEVYGVYGDVLTERDIDSRTIFMEIRDFTDFWMEKYEPILGDVIPEDAYLEYVTLAALCWFKSYLGFTLTIDDELMLCNEQRIAQSCRNYGLTLYDYDRWLHLEKIVDDQLTNEEYQLLNGQLKDDILDIDNCEGNKKDIRKKLEDIRNPKQIIPVYMTVKQRVKTFVKLPASSSGTDILDHAQENVLNGEYENDLCWEIDADDIEDYSIDYAGIQEG